MNWIFIGAGNMASSLIGGLINSGVTPDCITVVDPDSNACDRATHRFGISSSSDLASTLSPLSGQDIGIIIAVKPHIVEPVCESITQGIKSSENPQHLPLIISVAAGVQATSMAQWLPEGTPLVRCMPNTPALLGLGATALFANDNCSQPHQVNAEKLLNSAGLTIWVDAEKELDAVTAVSGSGPAYFFYLIEHMVSAGTKLGLSETKARDLAIETAFGAASMARMKELTPAVLRENVTSKGGTTAAALQVFNDHEMPLIVERGMKAAHDRAAELGEQLAPK